jgi:hypothetical protein
MTGPRRKPSGGCPVCGKPAVAECRPFCSSRCARIDLGRWLNETYRIPGDEIAPQSGTGGGDAPDEE